MTWELIDDLHIIPDAIQVFTQGDFSQFSDPVAGLFRPGYWSIQGLHGRIFGDRLVLWHASRLVCSLLIVAVFFKIVETVSGSPRRAALAALLYSMTCGALENQYRLGTAEPLFILLHLIALRAMIQPTRRRLILACASAAVAYTIKELAVVMLGAAALGVLLNRQDRKSWTLFFTANCLSFAGIRIAAALLGSLDGADPGRYELQHVAANLHNYGRLILQNFNLLLPVALVFAGMAWRRPGWRDDPRMRWALLFLGYALSSLALYLPYWICCRHYFIQASLGFSAFIAMVLPVPQGRPSRAALAGLAALAILTFWDFAANWNVAFQTHVRQSRFHAEIVRAVVAQTSPEARLAMYRPDKIGEIELRDDMVRYLTRVRPGLRFVETGAEHRIRRFEFNPRLAENPPRITGRVLGSIERPFIPYALAFPLQPRVRWIVETESWTIQP
jgi:hypothetical protein